MSDWVTIVVVVLVVVVISNQLLLLNLGAVCIAQLGGGGCRRGRCPRCGWAAPTNAPNENLSICTTFPTVPVEGGGFVKHTHTAHITSLAHTRGTVAHKCH